MFGARASLPASGAIVLLALADARASDTDCCAQAVLHRKYLRLDQFTQDVSDQVVRFLNALRVVAFDDQRKIAKRFHATAVAAEQANHPDSLRPRLLASSNNVRRSSRGRDRQTNIALRAQRFDLSREDVLEARVVSDASEHAAVSR